MTQARTEAQGLSKAWIQVLFQADFRDPRCFTAFVKGTNTAKNGQTGREETLGEVMFQIRAVQAEHT